MATEATVFSPAANWTQKLDSERLQEHNFANLVLEHRLAVERQDRQLIEYCECELGRMYRARRLRTSSRIGQRLRVS
jgi:hypothetical protein